MVKQSCSLRWPCARAKEVYLPPSIAEETKQHEEQVDEVEIENERAKDRRMRNESAVFGLCRRHGTDALSVVRSQTDEDDDPDEGCQPVDHRGVEEDIDDGRDNESEEP